MRDDLARRLGYVYRNTHGWEKPEVHWGDRDTAEEWNENAERLAWLKVADECLRQMEWARKECTGERWVHWDGAPKDRHIVDRSELPLTLAPKDWKP